MNKLKFISNQKAVMLLSSLFIFFYVYTGFYKIINIEAFKYNIARTAVFPEYMINLIPYLVILIEITVVLVLIFRKKTGFILFALSMFLFSCYILVLNYYGRYEVCGCGGVLNGLEFKYHLLINIVFLNLAFVAIYLNRKIENK